MKFYRSTDGDLPLVRCAAVVAIHKRSPLMGSRTAYSIDFDVDNEEPVRWWFREEADRDIEHAALCAGRLTQRIPEIRLSMTDLRLLYAHIAHGDKEHREWLWKAMEEWGADNKRKE